MSGAKRVRSAYQMDSLFHGGGVLLEDYTFS